MRAVLIRWECRPGPASGSGAPATMAQDHVWAAVEAGDERWARVADIVTLDPALWTSAAPAPSPAALLARYPGCSVAAVRGEGRWVAALRGAGQRRVPAPAGERPPILVLSLGWFQLTTHVGDGLFESCAALDAALSPAGRPVRSVAVRCGRLGGHRVRCRWRVLA